MDPQAALDSCEEAIEASCYAEAWARVTDYRNWRLNGGFEPEGGDARAIALIQKLIFAVIEESDGSVLCGTCNGSGEGSSDGTSCPECRGTGEEE